ncbi:MAG: ATPase, T2SS/T4P/T4SS family [Terriglobales bacterium]
MPRKKQLGTLLRERKHISESALEHALEEQKYKLAMLGEILLASGKVAKPDLIAALEEVSGVHYLDLESTPVDPELLERLPRETAERHCVIPVSRHEAKVRVAMSRPQDLAVVDELRFRLGADIEPRLAFREEILTAIAKYYSPHAGEEGPFSAAIELADRLDPESIEFFTASQSERHEEAIREFQKELRGKRTPAVHLVSAILSAAAGKDASDVHIEQQATGSLIRIRVDGLLRELAQVPLELRTSLVSRIKILCDMDIAERRVPQDGRLLARIGKTHYDLRVSTLPTQYGEKVTIRLLDPSSARVSFQDLGLGPEHAATLGSVLKQPQGMILVTGPTGSGKSTTLYAALHRLRSPMISILTIEDPVEYMMEGVNQVQVNPRVGRTFAGCLRSMLRQDPNVIMLGEIRDSETAEIAMEVSQTGHLVLSTLHTNDSIGAITRLLDLKIPAFLLTSSLTAIIAQRLVRKLCHCKRKERMPAHKSAELAAAGVLQPPEHLYRPVGCKECDQSGYRGRIGVYEMLVLDEVIKNAIASGSRDDQIRSLARSLGMKFMDQDALDKVTEGVTTLEEVMRVVPFEEVSSASRCVECRKNLVAEFAFCPYCGTAAARNKLRTQYVKASTSPVTEEEFQ